MSRKKRAYKRDYADLYDDPSILFPGCQVRLWPNGEPRIWIVDPKTSHGVEITGSVSKAGFGLHIRSFVGAGGITVSGNLADDHLTPHAAGDYKYLELTQYNQDATSQAFKAWYLADHNDPNRPDKPPDFEHSAGPTAGRDDAPANVRALDTNLPLAHRCECPTNRVEAETERYRYGPEEQKALNHPTGDCPGTVDIRRYFRKTLDKPLWLCSICHLPDRDVLISD